MNWSTEMNRFPWEPKKETRAGKQFDELPKWKQHRVLDASGDNLAFREFIRYAEGPETLINCIRGDHGLPNRF